METVLSGVDYLATILVRLNLSQSSNCLHMTVLDSEVLLLPCAPTQLQSKILICLKIFFQYNFIIVKKRHIGRANADHYVKIILKKKRTLTIDTNIITARTCYIYIITQTHARFYCLVYTHVRVIARIQTFRLVYVRGTAPLR